MPLLTGLAGSFFGTSMVLYTRTLRKVSYFHSACRVPDANRTSAAPNTSDAEPAENLTARSLGPTVDNVKSFLETADSGKLLVWPYDHSLENSLRSALDRYFP